MKKYSVSNEEKLTDKAFLHSVTVSIFSILLCIIMLCSITYAWFSTDISSGGNKLESGYFELEIAVAKDSVTLASDNTVDLTKNGGVWSCNLTEGTYIATLKLAHDATAKGYCYFTVGSDKYYTGTIIGADNPDKESFPGGLEEITLTIKVETGAQAAVKFEPRWGIPSASNVGNGDTITVSTTVNSGE